MAVSVTQGVLLVRVLTIRALLLGVYSRAPGFRKPLYELPSVLCRVSRAVFTMDIGLYQGTIVWHLLKYRMLLWLSGNIDKDHMT